MGMEVTLNYLRQEGFWSSNGRQFIRQCSTNCLVCKLFKASPFSRVPSPEPPTERVNFIAPFSCIGIDYPGHIYVSNLSDKKVKCYLLVFYMFCN